MQKGLPVTDRAIFLAIRPRFANAILAGTKTVVLRRTPPRIETPTTAYLYASSPTRAVIGICRITRIESMGVEQLWRKHRAATGVTRAEYVAYFEGNSDAHALLIEDATFLRVPVSLRSLRERWDGFHPPQSFRYLDTAHVSALQLVA